MTNHRTATPYPFGSLVSVSIVLVLGLTACGGDSGDTVTRAEVEATGDLWPFDTDKAVLECDHDAVTVTLDGDTYALNGIAISRGEAPELTAANPRWLDSPDYLALVESRPELEPWKVSVGPMIRRGLELCG